MRVGNKKLNLAAHQAAFKLLLETTIPSLLVHSPLLPDTFLTSSTPPPETAFSSVDTLALVCQPNIHTYMFCLGLPSFNFDVSYWCSISIKETDKVFELCGVRFV